MLKLKFLPYKIRTFLIRNGISALFDEGVADYKVYYTRQMKIWGTSLSNPRLVVLDFEVRGKKTLYLRRSPRILVLFLFFFLLRQHHLQLVSMMALYLARVE